MKSALSFQVLTKVSEFYLYNSYGGGFIFDKFFEFHYIWINNNHCCVFEGHSIQFNQVQYKILKETERKRERDMGDHREGGRGSREKGDGRIERRGQKREDKGGPRAERERRGRITTR